MLVFRPNPMKGSPSWEHTGLILLRKKHVPEAQCEEVDLWHGGSGYTSCAQLIVNSVGSSLALDIPQLFYITDSTGVPFGKASILEIDTWIDSFKISKDA